MDDLDTLLELGVRVAFVYGDALVTYPSFCVSYLTSTGTWSATGLAVKLYRSISLVESTTIARTFLRQVTPTSRTGTISAGTYDNMAISPFLAFSMPVIPLLQISPSGRSRSSLASSREPTSGRENPLIYRHSQQKALQRRTISVGFCHSWDWKVSQPITVQLYSIYYPRHMLTMLQKSQ
jgi:hypothetical protein